MQSSSQVLQGGDIRRSAGRRPPGRLPRKSRPARAWLDSRRGKVTRTLPSRITYMQCPASPTLDDALAGREVVHRTLVDQSLEFLAAELGEKLKLLRGTHCSHRKYVGMICSCERRIGRSRSGLMLHLQGTTINQRGVFLGKQSLGGGWRPVSRRKRFSRPSWPDGGAPGGPVPHCG